MAYSLLTAAITFTFLCRTRATGTWDVWRVWWAGTAIESYSKVALLCSFMGDPSLLDRYEKADGKSEAVVLVRFGVDKSWIYHGDLLVVCLLVDLCWDEEERQRERAVTGFQSVVVIPGGNSQWKPELKNPRTYSPLFQADVGVPRIQSAPRKRLSGFVRARH